LDFRFRIDAEDEAGSIVYSLRLEEATAARTANDRESKAACEVMLIESPE
jgi:hypothetical protein